MNKKILLIALVSTVVLGIVYFFKSPQKSEVEEKQKPIELNKHSEAFNATVGQVVQTYLNLKDAFVDSDTQKIKSNAQELIEAIRSIDTSELKKDSSLVYETVNMTLMDLMSNANSLLQQTDITEMRRDFSSLTTVMYPSFFNTIGYEGPSLYLQECPMAFNDTEAANWISNNREIVNPYLGKNHPKYKAGMLHCGELKDSITSKH